MEPGLLERRIIERTSERVVVREIWDLTVPRCPFVCRDRAATGFGRKMVFLPDDPILETMRFTEPLKQVPWGEGDRRYRSHKRVLPTRTLNLEVERWRRVLPYELAVKQAGYELRHRVGRAYEGGVTVRELAGKLKISRSRVHEMIQHAGRERRRGSRSPLEIHFTRGGEIAALLNYYPRPVKTVDD